MEREPIMSMRQILHIPTGCDTLIVLGISVNKMLQMQCVMEEYIITQYVMCYLGQNCWCIMDTHMQKY